MVNSIADKFNLLIPEAAWVFVDNILMALVGLLGIKLLTYALVPSEFGKLMLSNTIVTLVSVNLFGPFGQGLTRFWAISKARGNLSGFYAFSGYFAKYASLTLVLILLASGVILCAIQKYNSAVLVVFSLAIGIVAGRNNLRMGIFTAARRRRLAALLNISSSLLGPLFAVVLVLLIASNVKNALAGYLLAGIVILLLIERFYSGMVLKTAGSNSKKKLAKEIFVYALPFFIWGIFSWIHTSSDRWALQTFYGPEAVGAFAVVSQLAFYPLSFSSGFLGTLFVPIAFQKAGDIKQPQSIMSANKILLAMTCLYILLAVILICFFAVFHRPLTLLISSARFVKFSYLLPGLTFAWALFFLGQLLTSFGMLLNRPQLYILPKALSGIAAGITTFYLCSRMGPEGVVWGLAIAGIVYSGFCIFIFFKLKNFDAAKITSND